MGWTSFDCVRFLKNRYGLKKAGHAGTLDPIGTGLMLILVNEGTRLFNRLQEKDKIYEAVLLLGISFDTQDITGCISKWDPPKRVPKKDEISRVLESFKGESIQSPPLFSALKVKGKPAYYYARKGESVVLSPRKIHIDSIELQQYRFPHVFFKVKSGKGLYVRTLCQDIANKLETAGTLSGLRRLGQYKHHVNEAFNMDHLPETIFPHLRIP